MVTKQIYVAKQDLDLFTRAEELGGDELSSIITDALRRYVAVKEAEADGYRAYLIEVGTATNALGDPGDSRKVKLMARNIAEYSIDNNF